MPRARGKTQKKRSKSHVSKPTKVLTIPELRKSLDHVTSYTTALMKSGVKSTKEMASAFSEEWHKVFGSKLDMKTSEAYIRHVMSKPVFGSKGTRRKQRGGAALGGAPLDYLTRPGLDLPYGNFEKYVSSGFWNPEPAILQDCGKQHGDLPIAGMGSNRMSGGGLMNTLSSVFRPISTNPPSVQSDAATAWKGQPIGPGPEVTQQTWKMQPVASSTSFPVVPTYTRTMTSDVRSV